MRKLQTVDFRRTLSAAGRTYAYFSIAAAEDRLGNLATMPRSLRVLLENLLRHADGQMVAEDALESIAAWRDGADREIAFRPVRVLMQDFTGVPAIVDLAAMRDAMTAMGGDPARINPLIPVDLVIDHSVSVDTFGKSDSFTRNVELEMNRNQERYAFLRWGERAFDNFRVMPPGTGICHQVNLEYLAQVVWTSEQDGVLHAYPDTLVGTDSHTTMANGLSVLGWGVGGIEAQAAMLGEPLSMLVPEVVGFEFTGTLREGATATDLVLTVTERLRAHGVVGKFVEFFGAGVSQLTLADRATIANMAPEYGATCGFFPVDGETLSYLNLTGRDRNHIELIEAYAKAQGLWQSADSPAPDFTDVLSLDIATVEPSLAGPKRPQDRIALSGVSRAFAETLSETYGRSAPAEANVEGRVHGLRDGDVSIAAITSCTNTSNPGVMIAAGLVARKAVARGMKVKPWVKTSLAPGSQVVSDYLEAAGVQDDLDALGFNLVGYGCTTCIGNSGPLEPELSAAVAAGDLVVTSVLSGNRNFEGRVHPDVRANYLASPPLVVAYALAGTVTRDISSEPLGIDRDGKPVFLEEIWPSSRDVAEVIERVIDPQMFRNRYASAFQGSAGWQRVEAGSGLNYDWNEDSTYVRRPPFFEDMERVPAPVADIVGARPLAILGDSITTDHISPAGAFRGDSPAGAYLSERGLVPDDFNSYGSRRGNHEVMMRGTFANNRIRNEMVPGAEGGITRHLPDGAVVSIYDAAMAYQVEGVPMVVIAGKQYGSGSSRDWAAKGPRLLGVRAVIAESFERIHRANLVGLGVLPLEFTGGETRKRLGLTGDETFDILGIEGSLSPGCLLRCRIAEAGTNVSETTLLCRIDTDTELAHYCHGGILQHVLRELLIL